MSFQVIKAILLQEFYITKHSLEVIVDLFYFSVVNIVVFGFVSLYLTGSNNPQAAHFILVGMILWEIIRVTQYSISLGSLWNIWSRNLSNMFVAPLSFMEYMIAEIIAGAVKAILIVALVGAISHFVFKFDILQLGIINLLLFFINLTIFSWSIGIIILGLIFRYGTRIQALAWGIIFIFQPLTAVFFPVRILPDFMQKIAYALPPTFIFEAARANVSNTATNWNYILISFGENIFYFILALFFFILMFNKSKETGQFARNEG